jgi:predicted lipoprotein
MKSILSLLLLLAIIPVSVIGCDTASKKAQRENYDTAALLGNLGENVFLPAYREAVSTAKELKAATGAYVTVLAGAPTAPTEKEAARAAWKKAMNAWQQVEMMQVGPAADPSVSPGGKALRDLSYSWPTVNPCRVDQLIVSQKYKTPGYFETALVDVSGLDALEYLLFAKTTENACAQQANINKDGDWDALSDAAIAKRRAEYADQLAARLVETTSSLALAWEPDDGNFLAHLKNAGDSASAYESRTTAVDAVLRAIYYLELTVKDLKVAKPLGLDGSCSGETCLLTLESRYAEHSKENIVSNLQAFARVFDGAGGYGFDDALAAIDREAYAQEIASNVEAAIAAFDAIPGSMETALVSDRAAVEKAYAALKAVTDELKGELVTVLQLQIPSEGKGDTD